MKIRKSWLELLKDETEKDYFKSLQQFLKSEINSVTLKLKFI